LTIEPQKQTGNISGRDRNRGDTRGAYHGSHRNQTQESHMTIKRKAVAAAFRRMARGVAAKAAYANTVRFYRSSGQAWARQLG
jgi:hypothetical protein